MRWDTNPTTDGMEIDTGTLSYIVVGDNVNGLAEFSVGKLQFSWGIYEGYKINQINMLT